MSEDEPSRELVNAAEQLLAWQPHCSKGSSGDLRQQRVKKALSAFKEWQARK